MKLSRLFLLLGGGNLNGRLDKTKLLNDYRAALHKSLRYATYTYVDYDDRRAKYHYYKGYAEATTDTLVELNELSDGDINRYILILYAHISDLLKQDETSSNKGKMCAYTNALTTLDKLMKKRKYKI